MACKKKLRGGGSASLKSSSKDKMRQGGGISIKYKPKEKGKVKK